MRTVVWFAVVVAPSCPQHHTTWNVPWRTQTSCGMGPDTSDVVIVVAKHVLLPGRTVTADDLAMFALPYYAVAEDVFDHPDQVVGRVPVARVLPHEPMRPERFAPPEAGVGLRAVVPDPLVRVDLPQGASTVAPGDHVDLLVTSGGDTRTLFEGQRVVAVVPDTDRGVVVALPGAEAERVRDALVTGVPKLVLRSELDFGAGMHGFAKLPLGHAVPLSVTWLR